MQRLRLCFLIRALLWSAPSMLLPHSGAAQDAGNAGSAPSARTAFAPVPFKVGESLEFRLQAEWFLVRGHGTASLSVDALDTLRGNPTYRLSFRTKGGITVFKINDAQRSWLDARKLFSHRFEQKLDQTGYKKERTYEFFPGEMRFVSLENPADSGTLASAIPLDDVSFIYFIRTLPLKVGDEYTAARYYKRDGNPVTVRVLRTERIMLPAGEFDAVVVKPIIRTKGLFSEGGEAEVWFSNDARHIPLRVRAKVSIATLTMELKSVTAGPPQ
ncbi:DUF3108 domain-containing protein [Gemmatimonas phototrophica]|nr:DUF3108 domain-containing protein [Gemmatimonas phototrophica]